MDKTGFKKLASYLTAAALSAGAGAALSQSSHPDFTGIWSGNFPTQDDEFWQVEDFTACFAGCTPTSRQFFASLLDDPGNDERPVRELWNETTAFVREELAAKSTPEGLALQEANNSANDPTLLCQPYGLVRAATNPLPMAIREEGEHVVIQYEEWNESRTIYMDGRALADNPAPASLGHSVGRYENDALVIESTGIEGDIYYSFQSGGGYSDRAQVVERYTLHDDPRRLILELTVTDPVTLREPYVIEKIWLPTPDLVMIEDRCGDLPAQP